MAFSTTRYVFIEHIQPKPCTPVNLTTKSCLLVYFIAVTYRFINYGTWQRKRCTFWWATKEKNAIGYLLDFLYLLQLQYLWSHDFIITWRKLVLSRFCLAVMTRAPFKPYPRLILSFSWHIFMSSRVTGLCLGKDRWHLLRLRHKPTYLT